MEGELLNQQSLEGPGMRRLNRERERALSEQTVACIDQSHRFEQ
jgi:hypothetical protein